MRKLGGLFRLFLGAFDDRVEAPAVPVAPYTVEELPFGNRTMPTRKYPNGTWGDIVQGDELAMWEYVQGLEAWKNEAMAVESEWDCQAIARELDLPLGTSIRRELMPAIKALKAKVASLTADLETLTKFTPETPKGKKAK